MYIKESDKKCWVLENTFYMSKKIESMCLKDVNYKDFTDQRALHGKKKKCIFPNTHKDNIHLEI